MKRMCYFYHYLTSQAEWYDPQDVTPLCLALALTLGMQHFASRLTSRNVIRTHIAVDAYVFQNNALRSSRFLMAAKQPRSVNHSTKDLSRGPMILGASRNPFLPCLIFVLIRAVLRSSVPWE